MASVRPVRRDADRELTAPVVDSYNGVAFGDELHAGNRGLASRPLPHAGERELPNSSSMLAQPNSNAHGHGAPRTHPDARMRVTPDKAIALNNVDASGVLSRAAQQPGSDADALRARIHMLETQLAAQTTHAGRQPVITISGDELLSLELSMERTYTAELEARCKAAEDALQSWIASSSPDTSSALRTRDLHIQGLKSELSRVAADRDALQAQLERELSESAGMMTRVRDVEAGARSAAGAAQGVIDDLQSKLAAAEAALAQEVAKGAETRTLWKDVVDSLKAENDALSQAVADAEARAARAEAELAELRARSASMVRIAAVERVMTSPDAAPAAPPAPVAVTVPAQPPAEAPVAKPPVPSTADGTAPPPVQLPVASAAPLLLSTSSATSARAPESVGSATSQARRVSLSQVEGVKIEDIARLAAEKLRSGASVQQVFPTAPASTPAPAPVTAPSSASSADTSLTAQSAAATPLLSAPLRITPATDATPTASAQLAAKLPPRRAPPPPAAVAAASASLPTSQLSAAAQQLAAELSGPSRVQPIGARVPPTAPPSDQLYRTPSQRSLGGFQASVGGSSVLSDASARPRGSFSLSDAMSGAAPPFLAASVAAETRAPLASFSAQGLQLGAAPPPRTALDAARRPGGFEQPISPTAAAPAPTSSATSDILREMQSLRSKLADEDAAFATRISALRSTLTRK